MEMHHDKGSEFFLHLVMASNFKNFHLQKFTISSHI